MTKFLFSTLALFASMALSATSAPTPAGVPPSSIKPHPSLRKLPTFVLRPNTMARPLVTDSYGPCNLHWNGDVEPIVALNAHQMGPQSWGNAACQERVRIINKADNKSIEARVVDKCPGNECAWGSLDLNSAAFKRTGKFDTGILDVSWHVI